MVTRGQLSERMTIIPAGEICLDGIYLRGDGSPSVLVCGNHPVRGGTVDHPVPNEIAYAAAHAGHASLRFFWRGVGASEGEPDGSWDGAARDLAYGLEHLRETVGHDDVVIAGHAWGARAALEAASEVDEGRGLILVGPPSDICPREMVEEAPWPTLVIVGDEDPSVDPSAWLELRGRRGRDGPALRVAIVQEADGSFRKGLGEIRREVEGFLGMLG